MIIYIGKRRAKGRRMTTANNRTASQALGRIHCLPLVQSIDMGMRNKNGLKARIRHLGR
jgi:hypothetical protein